MGSENFQAYDGTNHTVIFWGKLYVSYDEDYQEAQLYPNLWHAAGEITSSEGYFLLIMDYIPIIILLCGMA